MAIKNLRPGAGYSTNGNLRSKGIDMKPVTVGDINNQVVSQVNLDLDRNSTAITKNTANIAENTSGVSENSESIETLAPKVNPTFTGAVFKINLLPTSEPEEPDQLWNDGGTIKISGL